MVGGRRRAPQWIFDRSCLVSMRAEEKCLVDVGFEEGSKHLENGVREWWEI